MLRSGHRVLRVVFEMPRILQLGTNLSGGVENCHFGKSFFYFYFFFLFLKLFLSILVFLSFIRFILPRCCWSFVVLCSLVLFLSFLSFPASSGLLYFSWEFFNLCLFILEGSDSLVSISGFRPLPG